MQSIIEVYNKNCGKEFDVPSERGTGTIKVTCDRDAVKLVCQELKRRKTGTTLTLPAKGDPTYYKLNTELTALKRAVRLFAFLKVPETDLPVFSRKDTTAEPITDVEAFLASI